MKKLFLLLLLISNFSFAETKKTLVIYCYPLNQLAKEIDKYDESPLLIANSLREEKNKPSQNSMILVVNPDTRTWTLLEKANDGNYCILAVGNNISPISQGKPL
jgi:hypothetical protein